MTLLKVKTLFLDDDEELRVALKLLFDLRNFVEYEWYKRAHELYANLNDNTQVVVIDHMLHLDDETGIEVIKKVKQINPVCHCILMSNQNTKKVIIDAYDNGCDKYIDKSDPNFVEQLYNEIDKGIEKVNREFNEFMEILSRMKETKKIIEEARNEITTR